ncbi:DNA-directed RNA polymerase subunit beta' [Patescibacteria group bacterium]|nr:DNA-directed RNA polymerase subunit beta' [Patescibacteria group bacterium]
MNTKVTDFKSITLKLASPEKILSWSHGEVTKPETINYRTQRAERNGLFCERIFGPEKDYECYCGKYRRVRYKGIICEKCGVEITRSIVRRERMGHLSLAIPVAHIWFLRGIPSTIGALLNLPLIEVEKVIYFAGYIITKINETARSTVLKNLDIEFNSKLKVAKNKEEKDNLKDRYSKAKEEINDIKIYKVVSEPIYYHLSLKYGEVFEAGIGPEAIYNIFKNFDLKKELDIAEEKLKNLTSLDKQKAINKYNLLRSMIRSGTRPEWLFLTVLPIIPPALRPMVALDGGRHATSDLNDLYRRVINRNNRLKKLMEIKAPEVIQRNEKRMLQESVDALIDNSIRRGQNIALSQAQRRPLKSLVDMLKGKQGRFRQNLLGKRVDYSGRSVIVVGPDLKLDQCGLPKHMALELFRPFVIHKLIQREMAYNIRGANRLIDEKTPEVWAILEEIIKDKHVLLNRAPTLHRLGIQAFRPILIEGNAIQIHPLVCSAFNADFDGDQMAVHVPLSEEAQKETREIIASVKNLLKPGNGEPIINASQDIVMGCFWMTRIKDSANGEGKIFSSPNEAIMSYEFGYVDLRAKIKVLPTDTPKYEEFKNTIFETTIGRLLFNSVLPRDFSFINSELTKKLLAKIVSQLIEKYGTEKVPEVMDKIKKFGFEYATKSGISWGIDDLIVPKEKKEIIKGANKEADEVKKQLKDGLITDNECYDKTIEIWQSAKNKIEDLVPGALDPEGPVFTMVSSSARGNWNQVGQMSGMKGLMVNPAGKIIDFPVIPSYKEGLSVLEYFITTHGARKGEADTALKTAKAGYLTRRLVDVAQDVIIYEKDCKDQKGILVVKKQLELYGKKLSGKIAGRVLAMDISSFKKGHLLSSEDAKKIEDDGVEEIRIFSPLSCNAIRGICQKCYGKDLGKDRLVELGEAVGIVAAQSIGEPGTQLTMRTFHTGGISSGSDITLGLPRVEEIFELRLPSNPAVLSEIDGHILEIKSNDSEKLVTVLGENSKDKKEYVIPFGRTVIVKEKDKIKKGHSLTDGAFDIKQLFKIGDKELTQNYILNEVVKVYAMHGERINDKHIEIIAKQMFSRRKVVDPGSSDFSIGEIVAHSELEEVNRKIEAEGGKKPKVSLLVMRISDVSLTTPSFLAAASFQNTVRVLVRSTLKGVEDKLQALKENVIIGRLIPAGTGFKKQYQREEEEKEKEEK